MQVDRSPYLFRWRNKGTTGLSSLSKVTQPVSGHGRTHLGSRVSGPTLQAISEGCRAGLCVALIQGPASWSNEPRGCPRGQGQMGSSWGNFLHSQFSSALPSPQLQPLPRYFPHFSLPTHVPLSPVSLSFNRKAPKQLFLWDHHGSESTTGISPYSKPLPSTGLCSCSSLHFCLCRRPFTPLPSSLPELCPALLEVNSDPGLTSPLIPAQPTSPSPTLPRPCWPLSVPHKTPSPFLPQDSCLAVPSAWKALSLLLLLLVIQVTAPVSPPLG